MPDLYMTLLCPKGTEEKMVDVLLSLTETTILTSAAKTLHGLHPRELDSAEQVLGGARATEIQVLLAHDASARVVEALSQRFRGSGVRYWMTEIHSLGEFT